MERLNKTYYQNLCYPAPAAMSNRFMNPKSVRKRGPGETCCFAALRLCSLHQTFVFSSLRSAIALVFHVPLHCAWHRWARSGCNAGRGATEAGLSILKEFRSRCSLDDAPALAASWEAALRSFSLRYARIWGRPAGADDPGDLAGDFAGPLSPVSGWKEFPAGPS